jgi:putative SOS response-associated peptidase YedK
MQTQSYIPTITQSLRAICYNAAMCGAYGFSVKDEKEVYERFEVANTLDNLTPRFNVRPGQLNPVIATHSPNKISRMVWGLIPHFAKDEHYKYKTINAKAETVAELPTFRQPLRDKRCLIPATGFYEPDKINYEKPPFPWHYFHLKDQALFAFAGLYDIWTDKETGKEIYSYTLITTEPNEVVGKIHGRMPVILQKEDEKEWLNPDITEPALLLPLLKQYPPDQMEEWQVGESARNYKNDNPDLIKPVAQQSKLRV